MLISFMFYKIWRTHNIKRRCYTHTVYTKGNTCYEYYVSNNMYTLCINSMCNITPVESICAPKIYN